MGFSVTHLLVVLAIVIVVFGTKRLRNIGADLGGAINSFRAAVTEGDDRTDAGGTTPRMGEVELRREQQSRATHGAVAGEGKPAENQGEAIEGEVTFKTSDKV
jgi:sec-independent protein translocase protein TatA